MSSSDQTKTALAAALRKLLETTPIERVTVVAIARQAGVNRQTFYYHFHDIYDLVSWTFHQEVAEKVGGALTQSNWRDGLRIMLLELQVNHDLVTHTVHGVDSSFVRRFAQEEISKIVGTLVANEAQGLHVSDENLRLVTEFYVAGLLQTLYAWIANGMYEDPDRLADRIALLVENSLPASLRNLSQG